MTNQESGKTKIAREILSNHGFDLVEIKFADNPLQMPSPPETITIMEITDEIHVAK